MYQFLRANPNVRMIEAGLGIRILPLPAVRAELLGTRLTGENPMGKPNHSAL